jgi:hypothetical protein
VVLLMNLQFEQSVFCSHCLHKVLFAQEIGPDRNYDLTTHETCLLVTAFNFNKTIPKQEIFNFTFLEIYFQFKNLGLVPMLYLHFL